MASYLNPTIISLDALDFTKLDVAPGTSQLIEANFAVKNAGYLQTLSINIDRDGEVMNKECAGAVINDYVDSAAATAEGAHGVPTFMGATAGAADVHMAGLIEAEESFHADLKSNTSAAHMIKGAVFTLMVRKIFLLGTGESGVDTSTVDFSDLAVRRNDIFFYNSAVDGDDNEADGTGATAQTDNTDLVTDIEAKTLTSFTTDASSWNDEMAYWGARTVVDASGKETEDVPFANDDTVLVMYQLACNFVKNNQGEAADDQAVYEESNSAIQGAGVEDGVTSFTAFNVAQTDFKFILQWKLTGL